VVALIAATALTIEATYYILHTYVTDRPDHRRLGIPLGHRPYGKKTIARSTETVVQVPRKNRWRDRRARFMMLK
jgi:hypothetical protein